MGYTQASELFRFILAKKYDTLDSSTAESYGGMFSHSLPDPIMIDLRLYLKNTSGYILDDISKLECQGMVVHLEKSTFECRANVKKDKIRIVFGLV